tara:strand:+ start:659 stop:862 length:204 start_codon:yes stop_codon:yes gene_type:complete
MTFAEYYKRLRRQKLREKKAKEGTGVKLYTKGMYDQPKRNAGSKNYVNTPPMMSPPSYTPTDTGSSR